MFIKCSWWRLWEKMCNPCLLWQLGLQLWILDVRQIKRGDIYLGYWMLGPTCGSFFSNFHQFCLIISLQQISHQLARGIHSWRWGLLQYEGKFKNNTKIYEQLSSNFVNNPSLLVPMLIVSLLTCRSCWENGCEALEDQSWNKSSWRSILK